MRGSKEAEGVWYCDDINVQYYGERASKGGLLLTEATNISRLVSYFPSLIIYKYVFADQLQCGGYPGIPGVFTAKQLAGWKRVTDAVHAKGGFIFCQLWHVGRATVPSLIEGHTTMSSSTIPITGPALTGAPYSDTPPRAMTVEDIHAVTQEFVEAAKRCIEAGFDGVELHG